MQNNDYLINYYNEYDEEGRLQNNRVGMVEYLTTRRYLDPLLTKNCKIAEIGAGTGRYSVTLAKECYDVTAVELVPHNLDILRSKLDGSEKIKTFQGNALDLNMLEDNAYDITLLLGPMYHLYTIEDQKKALSEAMRITKSDGYVFVAYCMVDPSVLTGIFKNNKVQQSIEDGLIDTETFETFFPPHGVFKLYTRDEIFELTEELNAERLHFLATDGYACHMREAIDKMDNETYELYLKYHFKTCERQDLIGLSHHTLDVLRKE